MEGGADLNLRAGKKVLPGIEHRFIGHCAIWYNLFATRARPGGHGERLTTSTFSEILAPSVGGQVGIARGRLPEYAGSIPGCILLLQVGPGLQGVGLTLLLPRE